MAFQGFKKYEWATGFKLQTQTKAYNDKDNAANNIESGKTWLSVGNTDTWKVKKVNKKSLPVNGRIVGMKFDDKFDMDFFELLVVSEDEWKRACERVDKKRKSYCKEAEDAMQQYHVT